MKQQITDKLVEHLITESEYWKEKAKQGDAVIKKQEILISEQERRIQRIKEQFGITNEMEAEKMLEPIKIKVFGEE